VKAQRNKVHSLRTVFEILTKSSIFIEKIKGHRKSKIILNPNITAKGQF
jgi:hypothetical protein